MCFLFLCLALYFSCSIRLLFLYIATDHILQGMTEMCWRFPCIVSLAVSLPMHQVLPLCMMPMLCKDVLDIVHVFANSYICNVLRCPDVAVLFAMRV